MVEHLPNLGKETDKQIEESPNTPNKMNQKGLSPTHIIIKMSKATDRILKAARKQPVRTKEAP